MQIGGGCYQPEQTPQPTLSQLSDCLWVFHMSMYLPSMIAVLIDVLRMITVKREKEGFCHELRWRGDGGA